MTVSDSVKTVQLQFSDGSVLNFRYDKKDGVRMLHMSHFKQGFVQSLEGVVLEVEDDEPEVYRDSYGYNEGDD